MPKAALKLSELKVVSPSEISFVLSTDRVAPHVFLETPLAGRFSDNGFVLLPGRPVTLSFYNWQATSPSELLAQLSVRSLKDVYSF